MTQAQQQLTSQAISDKTLAEVKAIRYNGNVSQYGWIINDKVVKCNYDGCHSQILSYPSRPDAAWSMGPNIPDIRLQYMFDSTVSPWRVLNGTLCVAKDDVKAGSPFVYGDLGLDANVLVNHMVAARWPNEQIFAYNVWDRLLLGGVHPAVADVLANLVRTRHCAKLGKYNPDKPEFTTYQYMHSNYIALDCDMQYVENFVNGVMAGGNGLKFAETKTSGCANDYAGGSKPRGYKPIKGAFGKFAEVSYVDQMKGKFGEYTQFLIDTYGQPKSFNDLVAIGLSEQQRFGLSDWVPGKTYASAGQLSTPNGVGVTEADVSSYEKKRSNKSHWSYVQSVRGAGAHAF
jgi:hypothetical protein